MIGAFNTGFLHWSDFSVALHLKCSPSTVRGILVLDGGPGLLCGRLAMVVLQDLCVSRAIALNADNTVAAQAKESAAYIAKGPCGRLARIVPTSYLLSLRKAMGMLSLAHPSRTDQAPLVFLSPR